MTLTASKLRENICRILDQVLETGVPVEVRRKGKVVESLKREMASGLCGLPFGQVMSTALRQEWTRDPSDRIIVGRAQARRLPLLTKDESIRQHYSDAVWVS